MFKKGLQQKAWLDVNGPIREVLTLSVMCGINESVVQTELNEDLPPVFADRVTLQQVFLNSIMNAMEE
jgi:nitrogen-specific signal transduction histidine kinase